MCLAARGDRAAPGLVRRADPVSAHDRAARREVRAGDRGHELFDGHVGVVDQHHDAVDDLAQVVRRDVRRHAHRDSGAAVDEQVREAAGQHERLGERLVVVRPEVDGLLVEVAQHLHRHAVDARLGVAHGCRRVAVDGAEVAVAVHERDAHGERLSHSDHRVVDRRVSVRVVLADDFAHGPSGLLVRPSRREPRLVHRVEDAPMHRLEPVSDVGKRSGDDDAHRVLEERVPQLRLDLDRQQGRPAGVDRPVLFCHLEHSSLSKCPHRQPQRAGHEPGAEEQQYQPAGHAHAPERRAPTIAAIAQTISTAPIAPSRIAETIAAFHNPS